MTDYVRFTDILNSYWDGTEKIAGIPKESEINPDQLEAIWDDCYLVDVLEDAPYQYDYLGTNLIEAYGEDISRAEVESLVYPAVEQVSASYKKVIELRAIVADSGEFINANKMLIKYRQLLLPFGDSRGNITHVLGAMRWRAF